MFAQATVTDKGVVHGTDDNLLVRFYFNKVHEKDFVKINIPGDNKTEWDQPVRETDKMRFRSQWEAYQSKKSQLGDQVLLGDAGIFDEAKIKTYQQFNIETVEQLAKLNDAFISKIGMGTREDVRKANNFLASQAEEGQKLQLERELQARDEKLQSQASELAALQEQVALLIAGNEAKPKAAKPKAQE